MNDKLSVRDILKNIINILLWAGIILPIVFYIYLFIKQYIVLRADGFGFLDTLFATWNDCASILLKLLIISGIFATIKIIIFIPKAFQRLHIYKKGISVNDVIIAENTDAFEAIDVKAFLEKYKSFMYNPVNVAALLPLALYKITSNCEDGRKMLAILLNCDETSEELMQTVNAVRKQLSEKTYLPKSYFSGAVPENNYEMSSVPTVSVKTGEAVGESKREKTLYIGCGGSGSYRPVTLKCVGKSVLKKSSNKMLNSLKANDDIWFIDDFPSILVSVKPPEI